MMHLHGHVDVEVLRQGGIVALDEKDMFSLWVKTACSNMNTDQLRKLADITDKYGRGFLLFTTRQTPHIPFIDLKDVATVKQELAKVELELDRCGPRVRNLNVCYEAKLCSFAKTNCISLGMRLENFFRDEILHKIKIGVAGCERDCIVARVLTDIGYIGVSNDGQVDYYDAYVGGRLGVNASVGFKTAESISEEQCVRFVQNYFDLISQGLRGERGADLIKRLGLENMKQTLNTGLDKKVLASPAVCPTKLDQEAAERNILRIRANCGEVTSKQVRKIAEIADTYGLGFVHFAIRGAPEVTGVALKNVPAIRKELKTVDLKILDKGIDNLQSCYAGDCTEGLINGQSLLQRLEKEIDGINLQNPEIKVSSAGCPNSCGIAHLSDVGFHGVVEPVVDAGLCTGCESCLPVCKSHAITITDNVAVIDSETCHLCGQCIKICPLGAIVEKRKGIAVVVGGREGKDVRLGETIAQFLSEDDALELGVRCLQLAKTRQTTVATVIDQIGIERFKTMVIKNGN